MSETGGDYRPVIYADDPYKVTYPAPTLQDEAAGRVSYVIHKHETQTEPASVQITVGVSASGKPTRSINIHAASVEECLILLDQAEKGLTERYG